MISTCLNFLPNKFCYFIVDYPYLGWVILGIVIIVNLLVYAANSISHFEIIKAKVLIPIAKYFKFKVLVRAATKADIGGNVNVFIQKLRGELPTKWLPKMEIKWVMEEDENSFLNENSAVLRMRPLENQDINFITGVYYFFRRNFFLKNRKIIPNSFRDASTIYITSRLIREKKPSFLSLFNECVLDPILEENKDLVNLLDRFAGIDNRGFLTGGFLREVYETVEEIKYSPARQRINEEITRILQHIEKFIKLYEDKQPIPDDQWSSIGPITNYSFLLVANPMKSLWGVRDFINRVKKKSEKNIDRLYVFGTAKQKWFARIVIRAIENRMKEYKLVENFKLNHDYRGEPGGIGALFIKKHR